MFLTSGEFNGRQRTAGQRCAQVDSRWSLKIAVSHQKVVIVYKKKHAILQVVVVVK